MGRPGPRVVARCCPAALLAFALAGCSAVPGAPQGPVAAGRGQKEAEPPTLRAAPTYETAVAAVDVPVPPAEFFRWFERTGAPMLGSFLKGIGTVPAVTRTEPLAGGGWRAPGDRRRLVFADGTVATEQILTAGPGALRVELWGLTGRTGRYVAYAVEDFAVSEAPSGTRLTSTRLTWTVAFEPVFQPPDGWVIRSWVRDEFRAFMQAGLDAMAARAAHELTTRVGAEVERRP